MQKVIICDTEQTLLYLVDRGCIEFSPWHARIGHADMPDYLVFDLCPEDIGFDAVVETALAVRAVCADAGAESYCKTSGGGGLHVYIPLGARYPFSQARQCAEAVGQRVRRLLPTITSLEPGMAKRRGKVYIGTRCNAPGQALTCAYSVSTGRRAAVSTPLAWDEVQTGLQPEAFTIRTVPKRVKKLGDLWTPVVAKGIDMPAVLERLS